MQPTPSWSVRIHYRQVSATNERTPGLYVWSWTGEAPSAVAAAMRAGLAFWSQSLLSGLDSSQTIASIETELQTHALGTAP